MGKIYNCAEAMVSDELMNSSDDVINAALSGFEAGAIIYTAGYKKVKQKALTGAWEPLTHRFQSKPFGLKHFREALYGY